MSLPLTKFDSSYGGMIYQGSVNVFVIVFKVSPECLPVEPLSLEPTSFPAQVTKRRKGQFPRETRQR